MYDSYEQYIDLDFEQEDFIDWNLDYDEDAYWADEYEYMN